MQDITNYDMRDVETLLHPNTNLALHRQVGPTVIERGDGIYVWDTNGRRYMEGMAGLWCTALGYGNEELAETAREQMSRLSFSHLFSGRSHGPAIELAEKLKEISPAPASKIFYTSSGSEANDTQIKLAWYYNNARGKPGKKKIISRKHAYHGVTIASGSLTGLDIFHADFDLPMARVVHTETPYYWQNAETGESEEEFADRLAKSLEELIEREGPDTIAAFIAEPVMGAGGVIIPPATYFEKIQAVLSQHDILFIADEVICGFGRTGQMFGSETFGIQPDTISMAKAITSAYVPLGAVTVSEDVYQAMQDESAKLGSFAHGFTYSGHPLACAVGVKTLEIYERINIVAHVQDVSQVFALRLRALADHPLVGDVRSVGLLGGIQLVKNKATKKTFKAKQGVAAKAAQLCQEEGLLLRGLPGDTLAICPPLVIDGAEVNALFDMAERGLDRTEAWARAEGYL